MSNTSLTQNKLNVPFNETCWLAAHNAFANTNDKWVWAQQHLSMQKQFEYGVRCFLVDFHWYDGLIKCKGCVPWCKSSPDYLALMHNKSKILNAIQHPRKPKKVAFLLDLVKQWLFKDTNTIITLIIEDYGGDRGYDALAQMLDTKGLAELCYVKNKKSSKCWTLEKMIRRNKRLVIITDHNSAKVRNSNVVMTNAVLRENHWEWKRGGDVRRSKGALALFNHFKANSSDIVNDYAEINSRRSLLKRIDVFIKALGMYPNYVALDYVEQGDGKRIVKEIRTMFTQRSTL